MLYCQVGMIFSDKCFLESFYIFVIIVLFLMSNYDGNIYPYKSSHLKSVFQIAGIPWTGEFAVECHGQTVFFLKKEENLHAK